MEFSYKTYEKIIKDSLSSGYKATTFKELEKNNKHGKLLLRHDIDIDLGAALEMAKVENSLGVCSTYFLMLRSPIYNLFSRENNRMANEIAGLGHEIALHFDYEYYRDSKEDINHHIDLEVSVLSNMLNVEVGAVSFHQPSVEIINNQIKVNKYLNTYDKNDFKGVHYISDSNMSFKEDIFAAINEKKYFNIQLLIHPIWWGRNMNTTVEIWKWGLQQSFMRMQRQILATERAYGKAKKIIIEDE